MLQEHWDAFGKTDPLWSILTDPERKGNKWDIVDFFQTGREFIDRLMSEVHGLGLRPEGRCLDFGCGVGRLSQALCDYFESCDGIDIAPSMIDWARRYNRHTARCRYHLSAVPDLRMFPDSSFSFVLSVIVLQHIEPDYSRGYIGEFMRVLKPGGIALFQVPSRYLGLKSRTTLPDSAYRAHITLPTDRLSVSPNLRFTLKVQVGNDSDVIWPRQPLDGNGYGCLNVGNHWRTGFGSMVQLDDGRTNLPELRPHQETSVALTVTAPPKPGKYWLEVDIVEEGVNWFAVRGVKVPRISVVSRRPLWRGPIGWQKKHAPTATEPASFSPVMEMHCITREEVLELVRLNGGQVIRDASDGCCGDLWESFHYIVTRRS